MKALLFILFLSPASALLYAQNFAWVRQVGDNGKDVANSIAKDAAGNIYLTGSFINIVDFDPGPGIFNLASGGTGENVFISKSDADGNLVWAKKLNQGIDNGTGSGTAITADANGNVYVTGTFTGTIDVDPGPAVSNFTAATVEIFLIKLDGSGNLVWAKHLGVPSPNTASQARVSSVKADASGNVYITGTYHGVGDFDPGPATVNIGTSTAAACCYIAKLDNNGNLIWVNATEGGIFSPNLAMALDASGNIYVTGGFNGITDFDPGPGTSILASTAIASTNVFIFKWNANGTIGWAKMMTGGPGFGASIVISGLGDVITTGKFAGTVDFDPNGGSYPLVYTGTANIYLSRLTADGAFNGARQFGGNSDSEGTGVALDNVGNIYVTGIFSGTVDFNPGVGVYELSASGNADIFIVRINFIGGMDWAIRMGGSGTSHTNAIVCNSAGDIYSTGFFDGNSDFDFTAANSILNSNGNKDMFLHKISNCISTTQLITASACTSYTLNGQTYTASGTYVQHLNNSQGCDSALTLNLSIGATRTTLDVTTCDSYIWNGQSYNNSGTYIDTLTDINGCDSIITMTLVLNKTIQTNISASICNGENYAGHTGTGIYTDVYAGMNGCDSIRTLNLTLKSSCIPFAIPNAFSPNDDGRNDIFRPTITEPFSNYSFTLFNRYGQKMFETKNYPGGWDGTYKGKRQPAGSYIYFIKYVRSNGYPVDEKGTVLLFR